MKGKAHAYSTFFVGAAIAGGAYIAWKNRKKIIMYLESEEGKKIIRQPKKS